MTSRFQRFTDAAVAASAQVAASAPGSPGKVVLDWRHRLVDGNGTIVASTDPGDGGINWGAELRPLLLDRKGASNKLAQMSVPATDLSLIPDAAGPLHPNSGYTVTIESGIVVDGATVWERQATMLVQDVDAEDTSVVNMTVELVDTARPLRSNMIAPLQFDAGDLVSDVVDRVMGQVLEGYAVAPTAFTTPSGSIGQGESRLRYVQELLVGVGHELTTTPEGRVITQPILPSADDPGAEFWRYGQQDGIPIDRAKRLYTVRTPQAWRVEGGSFQDQNPPITVTVYDTDRNSEGYFDGSQEAQIETLRAPFITSLVQAGEAGYGQLRKYGIGPMVVEVWSVPNPGVRRGDLVELYRPNLHADGRFRVLDYELPLQVDGMMRMILRKVYEPAVNYQPPNPQPDGCQASYSDTFDRPDENLENLPPGSPGSPDWEEHGWSWNIRRRMATQINANGSGWCLAFVKKPLCSADQYAEFEVSQLPGQTKEGPVVRSSGGFDGYAWVASTDNTLSLERWLNGRRVSVLGSYRYGSSLVGHTLRIQAVGRTIIGKVDGVHLVTVTDDAATGNHVGMLGKGGWDPNGPGAINFASGAAT